MRAAVTREANGPIEVQKVADPVAGTDETVVAVHAASVNRLDRSVYEGIGIGRLARFPLIQGIDAAGVVFEGPEAGARVVVKPSAACGTCRWCQAGRQADCTAARMTGIHRPGGFGEYVAVPTENVVPIPDSISFVEAAAAAHVHPVALRMMRAAELTEGETVLVPGAAGAVGLACVQLAAALGARVIGVCSNEEKADVVRSEGGDVLLSGGDELDRQILELTGGSGVDVVLDSTGAPGVVSAAAAALGRGGRFVVVGTHAGTRLEIDLSRLYTMRQRFIGSASSTAADFVDSYALMDRHRIHPKLATVLGLDEVLAGLETLLDRSRVGKTVIAVR